MWTALPVTLCGLEKSPRARSPSPCFLHDSQVSGGLMGCSRRTAAERRWKLSFSRALMERSLPFFSFFF